jgi:hypothetical protein
MLNAHIGDKVTWKSGSGLKNVGTVVLRKPLPADVHMGGSAVRLIIDTGYQMCDVGEEHVELHAPCKSICTMTNPVDGHYLGSVTCSVVHSAYCFKHSTRVMFNGVSKDIEWS